METGYRLIVIMLLDFHSVNLAAHGRKPLIIRGQLGQWGRGQRVACGDALSTRSQRRAASGHRLVGYMQFNRQRHDCGDELPYMFVEIFWAI
jgi:hypothetical protein